MGMTPAPEPHAGRRWYRVVAIRIPEERYQHLKAIAVPSDTALTFPADWRVCGPERRILETNALEAARRYEGRFVDRCT